MGNKNGITQKQGILLIFCNIVMSFTVLLVYSYFSYPSMFGTLEGTSANEPFLQQMQESDTVNINTASVEELMILPGIGEAKAKAIIAYRDDHGMFSEIEEIMNVSGIKEKTFEDIYKLISI